MRKRESVSSLEFLTLGPGYGETRSLTNSALVHFDSRLMGGQVVSSSCWTNKCLRCLMILYRASFAKH